MAGPPTYLRSCGGVRGSGGIIARRRGARQAHCASRHRWWNIWSQPVQCAFARIPPTYPKSKGSVPSWRSCIVSSMVRPSRKQGSLLASRRQETVTFACLSPAMSAAKPGTEALPAYPGGPFSCTCGHGLDILDRQCEWRSQGPGASRPEESESPRSLRDATKSLGLRFWVRLCWPRSGTSRHARTVIWHPAWGT